MGNATQDSNKDFKK